jgi:hypothetical protein
VIVIVLGLFFVLHGLVHLLYFGQSRGFFQLQPGMTWPDGSWALAALLGRAGTRLAASISCVIAATGFGVGGLGLMVRQAWWRPLVVASAAFSALLFVLFWDGELQRLDNKGAIGILINAAIVLAVVVLRWPKLEF